MAVVQEGLMSSNEAWANTDVEENLRDARNRVTRSAAAIENQKHYQSESGIEPIDLIASMTPQQYLGFLKANIIKYAYRCDRKDRARDAEKIMTYARWLKEYFDKEASGA